MDGAEGTERHRGAYLCVFIGGRDETRNHCLFFHIGFGYKDVKDILQADVLLLIVTQI